MTVSKIETPCRGGLTLVATANNDPKYPEVYIGVERNGKYVQDIAVVQQDNFAADTFKILHWDEAAQGFVCGRSVSIQS